MRELSARVTEPVLLVLDDIDALHASASLDLVADVVIGLPRRQPRRAVRRVWPRGRIAGLRHDWRFAQFDASSLRFSHEEGADLLGRRGRPRSTPIPPPRWSPAPRDGPLGFTLPAAGCAARTIVRAALGELRGDLEPFVQYFDDVVLAAQPADIVSFLLRTSALDRFTAALCDTALGTHGSVPGWHRSGL